MTRFASIPLRAPLGAAALAAVLSLAAPASATVDYTQYPTAVAYDAAEVMAKFGGVVIDVNTLFPEDNRALTFIGCGVAKRDPDRQVPADEQNYNFTKCGPAIGADQIIPPYVPPVDTVPTETLINLRSNDNPQ